MVDMPLPHRTACLLALAAAALAGAACGARSTLSASGAEASPGAGGAGATTGAGGSGGASATSSSGSSGGAAPPCLSWAVGAPAPIPITDTAGDSLLSGVAVEGDSVFLGSINDNDPSPDPTWRVRVVSGDLSALGPSQVVMKHGASVSLSGMGIAVGWGHRGGVAWDEDNGCRFVSLAADGSAAAAPVHLADSWCYWPYATPDGFTTLVSPSFEFTPLDWYKLDADGIAQKVTLAVIPAAPAPTEPYGRARLADGSLALAWIQGVSADAQIQLQHFSAAGDPLGPVKVLLPLGAATQFTIVALGASVLMVWSPDEGGALHAQLLDPDGNPTGPDSEVAPADGVRVGDIAVTAVGGGALAAWTKGDAGAYKTLTAQALTATGAPTGAPIPVTTPPFLGSVVLAPTPSGVVMAFDAEAAGALTQVFVTRLVCGP
jgi:hypothetical protein